MRLLTVLLTAAFLLGSPAGIAAPSVRRLTNVIDSYPKPSPDGTQIVFQSNRTGTWQLYLAGADGTNPRMIGRFDFVVASPSWSPDGKQLAFAGEPNGDSEIYVMNVDGTGLRRLTSTPGDDSHPHWSADGSRIMFNSSRTTPDPAAPWSQQWHELFSMKPDGGDLRQHTQCKTVCTYGSYSPDMQRIAYRKVIDGPAFQWDFTAGRRNSEVFVADVDGRNERNISNSAAFDGWPAWSPDGKRIAFASNRSGPASVGQIFMVSPEGGDATQATSGPSHVQPAWIRDGRALLAYQCFETSDPEYGAIALVSLPDDH